MARGRRLDDLRADAYKESDNEGATERFPPAEVTRYINQGRAERYDLMIEARGRSYFRKATPYSITTTASTSRYALPPDFLHLLSVRVSGVDGFNLEPFAPEDEPVLRASTSTTTYPTHYELQPAYIELLPLHQAGKTIVVEYVPTITDLANDADEDNGYNGWEDYPVAYAAMRMTSKDDEPELYARLERRLAGLQERIRRLAPKRDRFKAERVKDVRKDRLPPWRF